jgi:hypothetical protein
MKGECHVTGRDGDWSDTANKTRHVRDYQTLSQARKEQEKILSRVSEGSWP